MKKRISVVHALGFCFWALALITTVSAQSYRVEMQFTSTDTITIAAGDSLCFQVVAKDSTGAIVTDWSSLDEWVNIIVENSIAENDTMVASWSGDPDGYTWTRLTAGGQVLPRITPYEFIIDPVHFVNGVATICLTSTAAERNVNLKLLYVGNPFHPVSPPINVLPAALDNYLVEVTCMDAWNQCIVYAHRPFEVVVSPRDRFLNKIPQAVPARITVDFPDEIEAVASMPPDPFDPNLTIQHTQNFFFIPTAERATRPGPEPAPQRFRVSHPTNANILGVSDSIFVNPHAPRSFELWRPVDQYALTLDTADARVTFQWWLTQPMDPYTDIQPSRFGGAVYSDTVRYRIHFTDEQQSRIISYDSCDVGIRDSFTMTKQTLDSVITELAGGPVTNFTLVWYVEATDGVYFTRSTTVYRLVVTNTLFTGGNIALDASPIQTTTLRAGEDIQFDLHAVKDGEPVENWDEVGGCMAVHAAGASAENDTSMQSWSQDPDAYTWARMEVNGREIPVSRNNNYIIPPSAFVNGVASVRYRSSTFEPSVRFHALPLTQDLDQSSPPITWQADTLENFLVEITWHDSDARGVYFDRPFELIVTPRDRYLNFLDLEPPVRINGRFAAELDSVNGLGPNPLLEEEVVLRLPRAWMLRGLVAREVGSVEGQEIEVLGLTGSAIRSTTGPFSILPHAPTPFRLVGPPDEDEIVLYRSTDVSTFSWQRPVLPDPFTNIRISKFSPELWSDSVRYKVAFLDAASLTRRVEFDADNEGSAPVFTATHGQLAGVIDGISGDPLQVGLDVVWYVEATDGLFTTANVEVRQDGAPGHRLHLEKFVETAVGDVPLPQALSLQQNYPNPFNPTTTIRFSTPRRAAVSLKVYDLLGRLVATAWDGMVDAGEHSMRIDARTLPSGVYVYRLDADGASISRRMVVMK
ncbi:MAG: T9SS type A sorting domain-containing protein [Bacteroidota bacterium]|jgi:hypothetical protein|nr:T9SS type A sorting domain-containing protein [Bacteroidota bacterium]